MFKPLPMDQPNSLTCVDTSAAMQVNRITVDGIRPSPLTIRRKTGVSSRGITYGEASFAVSSLYGITLSPRYGLDRGQVKDLVAAGRPICISIHTKITSGTTRKTGSFIGGHTVYVNQYRYTANCSCELSLSDGNYHGEYLIEDPGTFSLGYLWWSSGLVYRAAEYRTGGNGINVLAGRDTEGTTRTATRDTNVYVKATKASSKLKHITKGTPLRCVSTTRGGAYERDRGGTAYGWNRVLLADGRYGYSPGEAWK